MGSVVSMLKRKKNTKNIFTKAKNSIIRNINSNKGFIDVWDGSKIQGWYLGDIDGVAELYLDDIKYAEIKRTVYRKDLIDAKVSECPNSGFEFDLDINELRAKKCSMISIRVDGKQLVHSPKNVLAPKLRGHIDHVDENNIVGWLCDESYPNVNLLLDIYINDEKVTTIKCDTARYDLLEAGISNYKCGFSLSLSNVIDKTKINIIKFKIYKTDISAFDEVIIQSNSSKILSLVTLQNKIRTLAHGEIKNEMVWINKEVIPYLIDGLRKETVSIPDSKDLILDRTESVETDVIIPVYKGIEETINCIESVFEVSCELKFNVIVINDCSPEPELTLSLRKLAKKLPFILLENEQNLGFVQTVNRGMRVNSNHDVLLLNSDTVVTDYWLDRIVSTAYSDTTIGTVTPFSNNATICSYPKFCVDNDLPKSVSLSELSECVSNNNGVIELPTAHGFSMFIKRNTLKEVGLFDDQKWGKGYAEENDFSLRAARLGWRNVMATNAFVHHLGSVSFAEDSSAFIAKNLEKLNGIYPDYSQSVESFIKRDPIRPYRNNIAVSLMKKEVETQSQLVEEYKGSYVFVSLTIGGGTEVATNELSRIHLDNNRCVFMLVCPKPNVWELRSQTDNSVAQFHLPQDREKLLDVLKELKVAKFHIHHTIEFDKTIWSLPGELGVSYDVTLHDYYSVCPRVNLVDDTDYYCGEPGEEACNRCIKRNGVHSSSYLKFYDFDNDIRNWREFFRDRLLNAESVITPSYDTKERVNKYFNLNNIRAEYHPEPEWNYIPNTIKEDVKVINVAFLGAVGIHKGLNVLKECAEYAYKFDLPIKFTVIGYTSDDDYFKQLPNVHITGKYDRENLSDLMVSNRVHVAALFSVWPETYSYTLSEAMRNNVLIATFDLGAVVERCSEAIVFDLNESPKEILHGILSRVK